LSEGTIEEGVLTVPVALSWSREVDMVVDECVEVLWSVFSEIVGGM
jgi:hypothetical protein